VAAPDLVLINDDDLSYAKIRLDEHSRQAVIGARGRFTESLPAAICWLAMWDMVRDGELTARDYLAVVLAGAPFITESSVLQTLLIRAAAAVRRFGDPAWRPAGLAQLAAGLRDLLNRAAPGSDQQLAAARALAGVAASPDDLGLLAGLLDGSAPIDGLAIDTELRWLLLHRLVSRGLAGQEQIDAELDRDFTDAGQRHAAAARAAIPTPAAKSQAWNDIVGGDLPNAMFRAALSGFRDPDQEELLAPYAGPFFDVITGVWRDWGSDMAQYFAEMAYPATAVSQEALDFADAFLARASLPPALRRLLTEGRDDVARSLRNRQRDARAAAGG
jgi:aminopeptidase N